MIKGKQKQPMVLIDRPNVNYRKIDALNQSMLKTFDSDPVKFYEEFKLGRKRKNKDSVALQLGDLVDFYILSCNGDDDEFNGRFDEKFVLSSTKNSGQVFTLAKYLFEETVMCLDEQGKITCSFEDRFDSAVNRIKSEDKYKGKKPEQILEDFEANGKEYFQMLIDNMDKTVVDLGIVEKARKVGRSVMDDPFTRDIFVCCPEGVEYNTHFFIEWKYWLNDKDFITCKSELDMLFIDHEKKVIDPIDLKTTYDNESFEQMYIKNAYYLQLAFYMRALKYWAKENGIGDYSILPMRFLVGDTSANIRRPLIYSPSEKDVLRGSEGFLYRGIVHRGIDDLITDIVWAENNDQWSISKEAFDNRGQMTLNIAYE
jgi:hypothetical protein